MKHWSFILWILIISISSCNRSNDKVIETSSSIEATNIEIRSKITGELLNTFVKEGQLVQTGDTLFIIDSKEIQIQLNQAIANYKSALAKYQTTILGVREEDKAQLRELARQAMVNFENSKKDFERIKNLFESQSVSQKVFDDAKLRMEIAEAQLKLSVENLQKAERGPLESEIKAIKSAAEAAKAQVDLLQKKLDDALIIAPSSGYISLINFDKGELISAGSLITKITNLDEVFVKIYVGASDLGKIYIGKKTDIIADAYPDKIFQGEIVYISNEAEFTPKNIQTKDERLKLVYAVKVKIKNHDHLLKEGMFCDVILRFE